MRNQDDLDRKRDINEPLSAPGMSYWFTVVKAARIKVKKHRSSLSRS